MQPADVIEVLEESAARALLAAPIPARLAYTALDQSPRVLPVGFHWTGTEFVVCADPDSAKVAAMRANPDIALSLESPKERDMLLVRGRAQISLVDGIPDEYLLGARRLLQRDQWRTFEADVRSRYPRMARIGVAPDWARVLDFDSQNPKAVAKRVRLRQLAQDCSRNS
ncbi:pyridoxamine 5'-phosphate oxidase family protein [Antrihabitans sp. YC2-6]|uniref:pyridoxamine 5'-phosphate oxidase family protein n=1 Tax=Antrihabitans sp. YC2-6 TaxID=2799498 RepID=UPI0018F58EC0|nr:pyridoxamine 5'-phosphate oxidase family protein [Antrihabitans sp. YC2-6]MBJ8346508.1 pyridoxamine 5'-phosphate oxidase family protein [Antrihabitans sp. YC2-6]